MIALVSDSSAQLPALLRERYQVGVVPITVVIDGEQFREGLDLTTADFYARQEGGAVVLDRSPITRRGALGLRALRQSRRNRDPLDPCRLEHLGDRQRRPAWPPTRVRCR